MTKETAKQTVATEQEVPVSDRNEFGVKIKSFSDLITTKQPEAETAEEVEEK